jgi:hypothetical protein
MAVPESFIPSLDRQCPVGIIDEGGNSASAKDNDARAESFLEGMPEFSAFGKLTTAGDV